MEPARETANPVLVEVRRGPAVESRHRAAWVLVDGEGTVVDGAGAVDAPVFARSAIKALQALPLLETGAAERFGFDDGDLAVAVASHDGEPVHVARVEAILERLGLGPDALRCGPQPPGSAEARRALVREGREPTALHNNCSGKHAGFLAVARHLDAPVERYLDPESPGQRLVRRAVEETCGAGPDEVAVAVDGCSAPTFRLPLRAIATAFARLGTPERLEAARAAHCRRLVGAVARNPELVAGSRGRLCTDLVRATRGRLFPKVGAEAVYAIGVVGADRGLALKVDDGGKRGLHALVAALVEELGLADDEALHHLAPWRDRELRNRSGLSVGRVEVRTR